MRRAHIEVLLLGENESTTSSLFHFMEGCGCHCSFATPAVTRESLDVRAFDLILSAAPLNQQDPLVQMLDGTECRVFYRFPVEESCWWVPLGGKMRKRLGGPAFRCGEFGKKLEETVKELGRENRAADESIHGGKTMMPARLKTILDTQHVPYSAISHAHAFGAQYAASVMHIHGRDVAKTVVLRAGKQVLLAVLPACRRVNLEKLAHIAHSPVELVEEEECKRLFPDCEPGVFPAFGELYGLPVYMDESLAEDPGITFSAGTRSEGIRLAYADFLRLAKPWVCSFAEAVGQENEAREGLRQ